jgi:hypothetical protein
VIPVAEIAEKEKSLGFERVELLAGSTFQDCSTVIVVPTRGMIHHRVVAAWDNLMAPMNQRRVKVYAVGDEVGRAYNQMIEHILRDPTLSKFKYILSLEDDNLPPPDAMLKLAESIELGPFDAVGGLYFTKGDFNMPMAYGDPKEYTEKGIMDFKPRNVVRALESGNVCEVNGIAMGCSLWRMDLFRDLEPPWFVTVAEYMPERGGAVQKTQDLYFCERMRRKGKRLAVDLRVSHLDVETNVVY